ncbi:RNA polymerase sigma factor [Bacteroides sp. 51]|uniref:RNA polymerase sigma factor n=1 Tax=Bacteroides sp. 51 TaxID=2302938 RepID=UPI0013D51231|nr:sigma-70 family RNA polymerase sigma factor [Bacteroides sp. 51]NDV83610.1 sigma-70 family RNA polymerase sigma factor [Bacteroides sp. 51]
MEQGQIQNLINKCAKGDTKAFALLVAEFQPLVYRLAFRLLCNEDEARDMVQETFIKVWLSIGRYDAKFRFSTWIYKITANTCYDKLRAVQFPADAIDISTVPLLSGEDIEKHLINRELRELIIALTAELTPAQRLVFTLRDLEELETAEVETVTGLSAAQIKSNLYLARKYIRERIQILNI